MALARNSDRSSLFSPNVSGTLRLLAYLALAAVLMVTDRRAGLLHEIRYATSAVVEPLYALAGIPQRVGSFLATTFADRHALEQGNARLREALLLANARISRMRALVGQNRELKRLLDVRNALNLNVQLVRVIGIERGQFRHRVLVDAGDRDGVEVGQPVIDSYGVVGQVIEVMPHTATVMLITDPSHAVPVMLERTGGRGIAHGSGSLDYLIMPTIALSADVKVGDAVLTSGLGGRFPSGFPVGEVISVQPDRNGMFARVRVAPAAQLDRIGQVLLLRDYAAPVGPPPPASVVGPQTGSQTSETDGGVP